MSTMRSEPIPDEPRRDEPLRMEPLRDEANTKQMIAAEVDRIARDAKVSSRNQFKRARLWSVLHLALGVPSVILAALAGSVLVAEWTAVWLPGVLALVAAVLMAIVLGLSPSRRARVAQDVGSDFVALQDKAQRVLRLDFPVYSETDARQVLDELVTRSEELAHKAPAPVEHEQPKRRAA